MLVKEFLEAIEASYKKHFKDSKCNVELTTSIYPSLWVRCFLANDIKECIHGYWDNDLISVRFRIDTAQGEFSKDITLDSELPNDLKLVCSDKFYFIKPPNVYLCYGRTDLKFRQTVGDSGKLLKALDKFFASLKTQLKSDLDNDQIHPNHKELVIKKLGGDNIA